MPYIRIWIHSVWAVKNRENIISKELKPELLNHIRENAKEKEIFINEMNCVSDHIHVLISLSAKQSIADVVRLIKGESSHWVNTEKKLKLKFGWQDDYYAVSVSESVVERVRKYIRNQEEHHRAKSFKDECDEFMKKYGFEKIND